MVTFFCFLSPGSFPVGFVINPASFVPLNNELFKAVEISSFKCSQSLTVAGQILMVMHVKERNQTDF